MQEFDADDVPRHHTAVKQHGEQREKGELLAEGELPARKRVGEQRDEKGAAHRPHHRDQQRNPIRIEDGAGPFEDKTVSISRKMLRNHAVAIDQHIPLIRE